MSATRSHHDSASTKKPTSTIYETIMPPVTSSRKLRETLRQNEKDTLPTSPEGMKVNMPELFVGRPQISPHGIRYLVRKKQNHIQYQDKTTIDLLQRNSFFD